MLHKSTRNHLSKYICYMIPICTGITSGRVLDGELYICTQITEVNLSAFAYRLFHEDFCQFSELNVMSMQIN